MPQSYKVFCRVCSKRGVVNKKSGHTTWTCSQVCRNTVARYRKTLPPERINWRLREAGPAWRYVGWTDSWYQEMRLQMWLYTKGTKTPCDLIEENGGFVAYLTGASRTVFAENPDGVLEHTKLTRQAILTNAKQDLAAKTSGDSK